MDPEKILKNYPSKEFWITNTAGWTFAATLNIISQYLGNNFDVVKAIFGVIPMIAAFVFTSALRIYWGYKNIYSYSPQKLILVLIPQSIITTLLIVFFGVGSIVLVRDYSGNIPKLLVNNFLSLYFIVLLWIAVYFVFVYYTSLQKKEIDNLKLLNSLQQAHLTNLKNQLNPHFLFNALNNIRSLIREDAEKSRAMITSLTDILRYSLNSRNEQKILLNSEIEFIREYLRLEHLHMEDRLNYQIEIVEKAANALIPPMIVQLLVENSIKHGISKSVEPGTISIHATIENEELIIKVKNSGELVSKRTDDNTGVGLSNLTERIKLLYGNKAKFELQQVNGFVSATLKLPLEYINESINS
ncbi:MAG: histidine kinase [Melioribacteraceae bacterium]